MMAHQAQWHVHVVHCVMYEDKLLRMYEYHVFPVTKDASGLEVLDSKHTGEFNMLDLNQDGVIDEGEFAIQVSLMMMMPEIAP